MTSGCSIPSQGARRPEAGRCEVRAHASPEAFTALAGEWRALLAKAKPSHPFYDPAWHLAWWKHLGSGALHLCEARRPGGELIAVAPFTVNGEGLLRLTGGEVLSDYLDIAVLPGAEAEVWTALLAHLEGPQGPAWKEMLVRGLPEGSPTLKVLTDADGPARGRAGAEREEVCPVIPLPGSWEDYVGMLDARDERELRRKLRKAFMQPGLEFRRTLGEEQLEADLAEFVRLHALSHPDKADFWNEARGAFFREMAREMLRLGWLDLTFLVVDGHPAAANFAFDFEDRIYLYNSGYDPNERGLSAGLVLLAHNIEEAINGGRASFDLLRGDEAYKYTFGAKDEPIFRVRLARAQA
ncbi:MAG: GNAT family N-acetyltransferase [Nitrospinota bacterium]